MKIKIVNGLAIAVLICGCCSHNHPASWPPGAPATFSDPLKEFRRDQQDQFSPQERRLIASARRAIREAHKLPAKGYADAPDDAYYRVRRTAGGCEVYVLYVTGYDANNQPAYSPCVDNKVLFSERGKVLKVLGGPECGGPGG